MPNVKTFSAKLPHHKSDCIDILITSSDFVPSGLAKVSVKLINANQTYMSSHWSSRPRVTVAHHSAWFSTTAFKSRTPLPSMCPLLLPLNTSPPTHIIPLMHPALRTTSGNCRVNQACQNCWRNHSEESVSPMQTILWFIWQNLCCLPSRSLVASADPKTRRPELIGCCAWCFAIGWAWLLSPVAVSCLSFSQTPSIVIPLSSSTTLGLVVC